MFDRLGSVANVTLAKVALNLVFPTLSSPKEPSNVFYQLLLRSRSQASSSVGFHIDRRYSVEGYIRARVKQPLNARRKISDDRRGHNKFYSRKGQICQIFPLGLVNFFKKFTQS